MKGGLLTAACLALAALAPTLVGGETARSPLAYAVYTPPAGFPSAHGAGETSIGVDRATNAAIFLMTFTPARITWDDAEVPPRATWTDAGSVLTGVVSLDPVLHTDWRTGRTFVAQLSGDCSWAAFTDDAGESWVPSALPCAAPSFDHPSIGSGPYPPVFPDNPVYPNAVYYCAQGLVVGQCARSDDGGLTWGAPVVMNRAQCAGLHGRPFVMANGNVLVPHRSCGARQGVAVSTTAGTTWAVVTVPGTSPQNSDPALAEDAAGRVYMAMESGGKPLVATTTNAGLSWTAPVDVGAAFGIRNVKFPMAVAGDAGRAAVAFYGTTTAGNDQSSSFTGEWHLYVASTFDAGATWETVDVTPNDPVQRGCIWMGGGSNACRNLLDFQGMTVDAEGRVIVGYADGCTSAACLAPTGQPGDSRDSFGSVARQVTGLRLFAAFDPAGLNPLGVGLDGAGLASLGANLPLSAVAIGGSPPYSFAWDLDDDGAFDDASGASATFVATAGGVHDVTVRATDARGVAAVRADVVRVIDPARERTLATWTFDAPGGCDAQGWTPGATQPVPWRLTTADPESGACAWAHAIEAANQYPPLQTVTLDSPAGEACASLDATLAGARFEVKLAGIATGNQDFLRLQAAPCGSAAFTTLAIVSGVQGSLTANPAVYGTLSGRLDAWIGEGPIQLRVRFASDPAVQNVGYQVDSFRLVGQD